MITAEVVCDSAGPWGHRLTTLKLVYPKFIHGELMTHRVFSRNASSSRAVPVAKLIAEVRDDATRAGPVHWGAERRGMQSGAELSDDEERFFTADGVPHRSRRSAAIGTWRRAALAACDQAERMIEIGVHKSIVNRILEPFSHIRVVVSATEWDNFFGLRLHRDSQPEMRALAEAMWAAREASEPELLQPGEWHLPFVRGDSALLGALLPPGNPQGLTPIGQMFRVSTARCARVSYESFETGRRSTVEEDLRLYEKLVGAQPLHASPAEHQATPDDLRDVYVVGDAGERVHEWEHPAEHGNFKGWRQHRKILPGEAVAPLPAGYR